VNQLAGTLTTQLRAISEVSTAVTQGDLTRSIAVEAQGEVAELKDTINQMITNLAETTRINAEQDWLNSNMARFTGMLQGERDLETVSRLIMSELTPLVGSQHGAFFMMESPGREGDDFELRLIATYGYKQRKNVPTKFKIGEALVGQAALEKTSILITRAPEDYIKVTSGLGEAAPVNIIVMPVLFEDEVLAVIELASLGPFSEVHQTFLDQLTDTIGVTLNTIIANMRTEELLQQSQSLAQELQSQSEELQTQQEELQQTNEELEEKARLLAEQNRDIEIKNREIEAARLGLEEKAKQLALSSKYKSEFLANMSHELRTPLNSLLILSSMLADNADRNLTEKQVEFAQTIYTAGSDLLALINDILDLSKVEAGKLDIHPSEVRLEAVRDYAEKAFRPVAEQKGIEFEVEVAGDLTPTITTDEGRLQQILNNLLSNAFKFTEEGRVRMRIERPAPEASFFHEALRGVDRDVLAFAVSDTGIGIPRDKLMLIFEAFQQADGTTSRKYGGTGLGLPISREIANLLGGEIHAESKVGEGSTFTLYLPIAYQGPEPAAATAAPAAARASRGDGELAVAPSVEPELASLAPSEVGDDRHDIQPGDRVFLVIERDAELPRTALDAGRERGFKGIVALDGASGLALAHEFRPDAVVVGLEVAAPDGASVLHHLKQHPDTRHIPVYVVSELDKRHDALKTGAAGYLEKPVSPEALGQAFESISSFIDRQVRNLLLVEDDEKERKSIAELIGGGDVNIVAVGSSEEALEKLEAEHFRCMVLDLRLPDMTGFALLEKLKKAERFRDLPVIVHTGKELTRKEETKLRKYAETIIVKDADSPARLLDETALFLHREEARLPAKKRKMLKELHTADAAFQGKKIVIVDDDVRNVFALTSALELRGMQVLYAENGRDGIELLKQNPDVDLVLMDIMMPEMDGYEAMQAVRGMGQFKQLPIIALTAKAMKQDREKSIASGASDYIAKPVDVDQLLSLMRVWLYQ
jgi:signal transduction histidine kinase/CheY-like chemotaxis protein